MEPLPKTVRERLQAAPVGDHPDADLLAAFAEQGLTARERSTVATHLATCHECRQIVALATPDVAAAVLATGERAPQPWFRWPVLRWGALAACVVVVGAAVVIGFRTSQKETAAIDTYVLSDRQASAPPSQNAPTASAETEQNPLIAEKRLGSPKPARTANLASKGQLAAAKTDKRATDQIVGGSRGTSAARIDETSDLGYAGKDKKVAGQAAGALAANRTAPALPSPSSAAPAALGGNVLAPQNAPMRTTESVSVAAAAAPVPQYSTVAKSKSAAAPAAAKNTSATQANHGLLETAASAPAGLMPDLKAPKWSLSADGLPQRSFDSGRNWEKIQVDHKTGFRALSAVGMDVWVGGRSGLLYHSSDVGLHWTRIIPVSDENTLSADITHIDFANALHGEVTTVTSEKWITSDGGKTWQRR